MISNLLKMLSYPFMQRALVVGILVSLCAALLGVSLVKGKYFAHTLNNTVVAPPRMLIAFLENNLNEDGSVRIPAPLRPYMGGKEVLKPIK